MFNNFDDFLDFLTEGKIRKKKPQKKILKEMALFQRKSDGAFVNAKGNSKDASLSFVLNRPSDGTIKNAPFADKVSVYQQTSLFLYGQLLFDLGIMDKVYRSTRLNITKNKSKTYTKYQSIIFSFLDTFDDDDSFELARAALQETSDVFEEKCGFTPSICLNRTKDWNDLINPQFLAKCLTPYVDSVFGTEEEKSAVRANAFRTTQKFLGSYSDLVDKDVDANARKSKLKGIIGDEQDKVKAANTTSTDTKVRHIKNGVAVLLKFFESGYNSGISLPKFRTRLQAADKLKTVLSEPDAKMIKEAFLSDKNDTVGTARVYVDQQIDKERSENKGTVGQLANVLDDGVREFFSKMRRRAW